MKNLLLIFAASFVLFACDSRPEAEAEWEIELAFDEITLDPGSNSLQLNLPESPKSFAESKGLDPASISKAEVVSAEVMTTSSNFDDIEMVLLQMASTADMKSLAIGENEEKGKTSLSLEIPEDTNASEHFKSDEPIVVLEVNAIEGGGTYKFKTKIKFKLISKKL